MDGTWERGVRVGDVLSGVDFSKEVGRMEMSLGESLEMTLARALPAYRGLTNVSRIENKQKMKQSCLFGEQRKRCFSSIHRFQHTTDKIKQSRSFGEYVNEAVLFGLIQ